MALRNVILRKNRYIINWLTHDEEWTEQMSVKERKW